MLKEVDLVPKRWERIVKPLEKPLDYAGLMAKLRGPGNGLGDIYQIDIGVLNIAK